MPDFQSGKVLYRTQGDVTEFNILAHLLIFRPDSNDFVGRSIAFVWI